MRRLPLIAALLAWPATPAPVGPVATADDAGPRDGLENAPPDGLARMASPAFGNEAAKPAFASPGKARTRASRPIGPVALAPRTGAPPQMERPAPEQLVQVSRPMTGVPVQTPKNGAHYLSAASPLPVALLDYSLPDDAAGPVSAGLAPGAGAPPQIERPAPEQFVQVSRSMTGVPAQSSKNRAHYLSAASPLPVALLDYSLPDDAARQVSPGMAPALAPQAERPAEAQSPVLSYDTGALDAAPPAALTPSTPAPALAYDAAGLAGDSALAESSELAPAAGPAPPTIAYRETGSEKSVFEGDFLIVAAGVVALPSYEGSDNTSVIPAAAIAGSIAGIGINPRAGGLALDLVPDAPGVKLGLSLGPVARIRANRTGHIGDPVVAKLGKLDTVIEAGVAAGVTIRRVLNPHDRLSLGVDARWDVSGHGSGYVISPSASYLTPLSRAMVTGLLISAEFADGRYAHYNYDVAPAGAVASGLPAYSAKGGLKAINYGLFIARDLNANLLDGGLSIGVGGMYQRLYGSAAASPLATIRGSANQWIVGGGLGYVF